MERGADLAPLDPRMARLAARGYFAEGEENKALPKLKAMLRLAPKDVPAVAAEMYQFAELLRRDWPDDIRREASWLSASLRLLGETSAIAKPIAMEAFASAQKEMDPGTQALIMRNCLEKLRKP